MVHLLPLLLMVLHFLGWFWMLFLVLCPLFLELICINKFVKEGVGDGR